MSVEYVYLWMLILILVLYRVASIEERWGVEVMDVIKQEKKEEFEKLFNESIDKEAKRVTDLMRLYSEYKLTGEQYAEFIEYIEEKLNLSSCDYVLLNELLERYKKFIKAESEIYNQGYTMDDILFDGMKYYKEYYQV